MAVEPDAEQFARIAAVAGRDADGPVVMLNLNRYRDREAYMRYGAVAAAVLERVGGRILWHTDAKLTVIGGESLRRGDRGLVPEPGGLRRAGDRPRVLAVRAHRLAGLEQAALICCEPRPIRPACCPASSRGRGTRACGRGARAWRSSRMRLASGSLRSRYSTWTARRMPWSPTGRMSGPAEVEHQEHVAPSTGRGP